jgi:hypothetical protein
MRTYRAGAAVLAALLVTFAVSAAAPATTTGIRIEGPQLVVQRGSLAFNGGGVAMTCRATLFKRLITQELIPVTAGLTKLGKIRAGHFGECPFATTFLNLPPQLGMEMPGPLPESWDISYLSSNLVEGQLSFGILDFQVSIVLPGTNGCLYRGTLLGTLSTNGRFLRYATVLPLAGGFGCPAVMAIEGTFVNEPVIRYALLVGDAS